MTETEGACNFTLRKTTVDKGYLFLINRVTKIVMISDISEAY